MGAKDVADRVLDFIRYMTGEPAKLVSARPEGALVAVTYKGEGKDPQSKTVWATPDAAVVAPGRVDIETRLDHLQEFDRWTDCLRDKGVQLFVDTTEEESRKQMIELGPFAARLTVECKGPHKARCKALGVTTMPQLSWPKGNEVGLLKRKQLTARFGCRIRLFQEVAAPAHVDPRDLGARVRLLHARALKEPVDLVSVRREDEVYRVVLARGRTHPRHTEITVSKDGVFILTDAMTLTEARRRVREQRRFATCLTRTKTTLFIDSKQPRSVEWAAPLGPAARKVVVDCSAPAGPKGRGGAAICKERSVTRVPAAARAKGKAIAVRGYEDLESLTGCNR